jgi:rhodanese-related sulfurtransferase
VAESYKKKGFENVKALKGGVSAWKDAGYPVV